MKNYNYEKSIRNFAKVLQLGEPFWASDSLQMLCPFHIEENASFGINTKTRLYNCFACNNKGHFSKIISNLKGNIIAEKCNSIGDFAISAKIDTVSFSAKPKGKDIGSIRNRLDTISYSKYTIDELIELITSGHTVSLSGVNSGENWTCQQVCMIDLDNEYQGITMEEVINYVKSINLEPVSNKVFGDIIKSTEFNDIKYQKKKLVDPETGKQKYYYVSSDYTIKETYNPMVSLYGDNYMENLINAIEAYQLSNEEFNILKEHIDNRSLEYPEFDFELDAEALEDLET